MVTPVTEAVLQQAFDAGPLVYAETRDAFVAQLRRLSDADAAQQVPTCPGWSVKDVVSHVAGLVADLLNGEQPPLGTDEKTARQVSERTQLSLDQVCDEWSDNASPFGNFLAEHPRYGLGLTGDLATHVHDIADTLRAVDPPAVKADLIACHRYVPLLQERVAERCDVALTVTLDDLRWDPPSGAAALALATTPTELLCSVTGRRTRAHVENLAWTGDHAAVIDGAFTQYGPYRR